MSNSLFIYAFKLVSRRGWYYNTNHMNSSMMGCNKSRLWPYFVEVKHPMENETQIEVQHHLESAHDTNSATEHHMKVNVVKPFWKFRL